jgi:hypothetical protein
MRIVDPNVAARHANRRGRVSPGALLRADLVSLTLAFLVAELGFGGTSHVTHRLIGPEYVVLLLGLPIWVWVAQLYGLYTPDEKSDPVRAALTDLFRVFNLMTAGTFVVFVVARLTLDREPILSKLIAFWGSAVVLITVNRVLVRLQRGRRD